MNREVFEEFLTNLGNLLDSYGVKLQADWDADEDCFCIDVYDRVGGDFIHTFPLGIKSELVTYD